MVTTKGNQGNQDGIGKSLLFNGFERFRTGFDSPQVHKNMPQSVALGHIFFGPEESNL